MSSKNIYNIYKATNLFNNKSYIGFTNNLTVRILGHKRDCFVKKLDLAFYNAIRKYGWENFEWSIIYQSKDKYYTLEIMENYFINEYKTYIHFEDSCGYNMTLGGESCSMSDETKQKLSYTKMKTRYFISPEGIEFEVKNLKQFCIDNNLSFYAMCDLWLDRTISHKGWHKKDSKFNDYIPKTNCKEFYFSDPNYNIIYTNNLKLLCEKEGLSYRCMTKVTIGKSFMHKGWTLYDSSINYDQLRNNQYTLYSKIYGKVTFKNILYFCRSYGITYGSVTTLIDSDYNRYIDGWSNNEEFKYAKKTIMKYKLTNIITGEYKLGNNIIKLLHEVKISSRISKRMISGEVYKNFRVDII